MVARVTGKHRSDDIQQYLPSSGRLLFQQNEKSSLMKKLEKQAIELEEVKRQLTSALRQLSSAEEELLRLRQRQQDVVALEKQVRYLEKRDTL